MEAGHTVVSLGIDYGQRHKIEMEYARVQCAKYGIERRIIRIEWDKPVRPLPVGRSINEIRSGESPAFLPGRNVVFLSLACAEAAGVGAQEVWVGINAIDFSGYPDCRPEFVRAFKEMIAAGIPNLLEVVAPLLHLSKPQIAAEAMRLGLGPRDTWSCYQPFFSNKGIVPCGECDACKLHAFAWQHLESDGSAG
jgi:7-cyano-7-deazaguanine synthase